MEQIWTSASQYVNYCSSNCTSGISSHKFGLHRYFFWHKHKSVTKTAAILHLRVAASLLTMSTSVHAHHCTRYLKAVGAPVELVLTTVQCFFTSIHQSAYSRTYNQTVHVIHSSIHGPVWRQGLVYSSLRPLWSVHPSDTFICPSIHPPNMNETSLCPVNVLLGLHVQSCIENVFLNIFRCTEVVEMSVLRCIVTGVCLCIDTE